MRHRSSLYPVLLAAALCAGLELPAQTPLAEGKPKFLGGISSPSNDVDLLSYWNQVTPENAGKWGSVEGTRDVFNWSQLDTAYQLAKDNGLPFRFHILVWGAQQPAWMASLPEEEQLAEIQEWFEAVAARYPDIDYVEVVNEPLHQPPDASHEGNYINALGGAGTTGWDWVLNAFRMARPLFPDAKLVLNEYSVINDGNALNRYLEIIELLQAEDLVDIVAEQAHSFTTVGQSTNTLRNNLNTLAATGLPIMITEMDIDGSSPTMQNDTTQLQRYQTIFPVLWEHPAVMGITTWGYRPVMWRENAVLVLEDGTERAAMTWLRDYVTDSDPPLNAYVLDHPADGGAPVGEVATFTVGVIGHPAPTIQWQRSTNGGANWENLTNGGAFSGVTTATLSVSIAADMQGHLIRAVASNTLPSSSTSRAAEIGVAPDITAQPSNATAAAGGSVTFTVTASGDGPLTYQWRLNGKNIPGATAATYTIPSVQNFHAGEYTVVVTGSGAAAVSQVATLTVNPATTSPDARLINLSTRAFCQTGDNVMIPGFYIAGTGTKRLLIRAVGPTLSEKPFNLPVTNVLPDPRMRLMRLNTSLTPAQYEEFATNDNWEDNVNAAEIEQTRKEVFAFPFKYGDEAALLVDLPPGQYTVIADDVENDSGIAVVELYDADDDDATSRLINISNRGFASTGDQVMIPGFSIVGGTMQVLVRAVGPRLAQPPFNLAADEVIEDPQITLYHHGASGPQPILSQSDWDESPTADETADVAKQVSAFSLPPGSADAAFVVSLPPGVYSAIASPAAGTDPGIVVVEVYVVLPPN